MQSLRWLKIPLVLAGLLLVVLLTTPLAIKYVLSQWLRDNGGEQVSVRDVDFNPFTATLVLKGVRVQVGGATPLDVDSAALGLAWLPLFERQIDVQRITLSGFAVTVDARESGRLRIGGIQIPVGGGSEETAPAPDKPAWLAGVDAVSFTDVDVRYLDSQLDLAVKLDTLALDALAQWTPESAATLRARGSLNGAAFDVDGALAPFAGAPHYRAELTLTALALEDFAALAGDALGALGGRLSYAGTVAFEQTSAGFTLSQEGTTGVQALTLNLTRPALQVRNAQSEFKGSLQLASAAQTLDVAANYTATLSGLDVDANEGALPLAHVDSLSATKLSLQGPETIALESLDIGGLTLIRDAASGDAEAFFSAARMELAGLDLAENRLSVDSLVYRDARSFIRRQRDGGLWIATRLEDLSRQMAATDAAGQDAAEAAEPATQPLTVALDRLEIAGDSAVHFIDQSVEPAFETRLTVAAAKLEHIDTGNPAQMSPISLKAGIGKHTRITLDGKAAPLAQPVGMNIKADINALDLPGLSPYTRDTLGLVLDSGTLDSDAEVRVASDSMAGEIRLRLHQLELETRDVENSLQSRIPVPLNVALDTLRDSHNTISLKIPVEGDPANPDFNINDVIGKALASGVQKGALTYLTLALQPYGTLITAAKYAGEAINKVRLNAVEFDAGAALLDDTDRDYLTKVAAVLKERPKLAVKLCGVATQADVQALQQQAAAAAVAAAGKSGDKNPAPAAPPAVEPARLQALAQARAEAVKDYMVDTHGTPADRLVGCRPRVEDRSGKGAPRADLLI